jgi:hypothetical protein
MMKMPMPERGRVFLEARCLEVCRRRMGCKHLQRVVIGRIKPIGSGPNWEVLAFEPELPPVAFAEAMKAADILRGTFALAPTRR